MNLDYHKFDSIKGLIILKYQGTEEEEKSSSETER